MKHLAAVLVLVALLALTAASGASARMWHHKPATHSLVKKANKSGERHSAHSLL